MGERRERKREKNILSYFTHAVATYKDDVTCFELIVTEAVQPQVSPKFNIALRLTLWRL